MSVGDMTPEEQERLIKEAVKEAAKEWLEDQYRLVGKWTIRTVLAALVVALTLFILALSGWRN